MNKAIEYLRSIEWSLAGRQCPKCFGHPESSHSGSGTHKACDIGHVKDCSLADSLVDLGETVTFLGDYESDIEYESYWREDGLLCSRIKV